MKIIHGDWLEVMKDIEQPDLILTDPPYPDYHTELYGYKPELIESLDKFDCKQLVFWSAKVEFPLDYTAIHIWDKMTGISTYERIFERNGNHAYKVYRIRTIHNKMRARMEHDEFSSHPSQKPIKLIQRLIQDYSNKDDLIIDPFMGSGTTAVACKKLGRNFIGVEIEKKWVDITKQRLQQEVLPLSYKDK